MARRKEKGSVALEALIGMTLFIMIFFGLYSMSVMCMANSAIGHALSESAQSLALETYQTSIFDDGKAQLNDAAYETIKWIYRQIAKWSNNSDADFIADENLRWFDTDAHNLTPDKVSAALQEVAPQRFAAFLSGSVEAADAALKNYGVKDGLSGIDFKESKLDGKDLILVVRYRIRLLIPVISMTNGFETAQKVTVRIWGKE